MKAYVFWVFVAVVYTVQGIKEGREFRPLVTVRQVGPCKQEVPDCEMCLQKPSCKWCNEASSTSCRSSNECPARNQLSSCQENALEDRVMALFEDNSYTLDVPLVTVNATYLCHLNNNCSTCTRLDFCAWCNDKETCVAYSGATTLTKACGGASWYRKQCTYKEFTTPCPERAANCKECLSDDLCYWCQSTKQCGYYPGEGFRPVNCSSENWFYKTCLHMKEIIVLLPILFIVLTPVIAYLVMFSVVYCMKKAGYSDADDSDSSDDEDKRRRPIMLKHRYPSGKTDKLRKKYDLSK